MNTSFYTAITGAKSQQVAVDTTGNNIANINTTGYRGSQIEFATLYSKTLAVNYQTQVSNQGLGSRVSATAIDMRAGTYQNTGNTFDIAINGNGWFGVSATNTMDAKQVGYTRDGAFSVDRDGHLVNQSGHYVLGSSYGNLVNIGGQWQVDPAVAAGGLRALGTQSLLSIPSELNYPPAATTRATLSANLPGNENSKTTRALPEADLAALFDRYGRPMNITAGQSVLIGAGSETLNAADGVVTLNKTLIDGAAGPLTLTLNGTAVSADWPAGSDASAIAQAIAAALNAVAGVNAQANGSTLSLSAERSLVISGSSDTAMLGNVSGTIFTYGEENFQTLEDLRSGLEETLIRVYGNGPKVTYRSDGTLQISALDPVKMQIKNTGNSNAALINSVESLAAYEGQSLTSLAFSQAWQRAVQDAVSPSGEKLRLQTTLIQTRPAQGDDPAVWSAQASLQKESTATAATDLGSLIYQEEALGLAAGENLWFSFGKHPATVSQGFGYALPLVRDEAEGTAPVINFTLDGQNYSVTAADGAEIADLQNALETVLHAAGYQTTRSGSHLIIHPRGETLTLTGGSTNLDGVVIDPMSLGVVTYGEGGVNTLGQLLDRVNTFAAPLSAALTLENGVIKTVNNGFSTLSTAVLSGQNSSEGFRKTFASLAATLAPGSQSSTASLKQWETLSAQSGTVTFDASGRVTTPNTLTLNNGGTPLEVTLDLSAWQQSGAQHSFVQNGVMEGRLNGYSVDENGAIIANFTNAKSTTIGQLAVYHFANDQGLMRISGNLFMESANSGEPFFWLDENGNAVPGAILQNQTLEGSNVQSALALTDLIIHQRAYEGNAKAITTSDELIKNAIQMKR